LVIREEKNPDSSGILLRVDEKDEKQHNQGKARINILSEPRSERYLSSPVVCLAETKKTNKPGGEVFT